MEEASAAIEWYLNAKRLKKRWAQSLRASAILLTAVAGLIPILAELLTNEKGETLITPGWASVSLLLAATCVGLDQFFGFSSAWIRFINAETQIRDALDDFQFESETKWSTIGEKTPSGEQGLEILSMCQKFLNKINEIVANETDRWTQEFSAALKDIETSAKAKIAVDRLSAVNIVVSNGDKCEDGWTLEVDSGSPKTYVGKTAAVDSLIPGNHKLRARGVIGAKQVQSEKVFATSSGSTIEVDILLEG